MFGRCPPSSSTFGPMCLHGGMTFSESVSFAPDVPTSFKSRSRSAGQKLSCRIPAQISAGKHVGGRRSHSRASRPRTLVLVFVFLLLGIRDMARNLKSRKSLLNSLVFRPTQLAPAHTAVGKFASARQTFVFAFGGLFQTM